MMVTKEEIKDALWSIKAFKALGLDGLHASFFQRFWLVVGDSVVEEVMKAFEKRRVPEYLNETHIVLIPKIQGPEVFGNYGPICLCNTVYKIITKVIVARLRPYLEKLVSPYQAAFVLGRRGVDNTIIIQELIHSIGRTKGRKGYMAIKIDLEKAYDKLEWGFILDMLARFNFPSNLLDLIMSCISSMSTSLLFNGGKLESFCPSRGIRQGDPLSLHLFILFMEFLGALIKEKCNSKLWTPVKTSKSGLAFSHLFFADDLILFAKADPENCATIKGVIEEFCVSSGQTISSEKSRVYFSPNIDSDQREVLANLLGFPATSNLGKYLGYPLKHSGSRRQDFRFVLDRVKKKLTGWKANLLSMAGRIVLIQSSSSTIPTHVMQNVSLPNKILEGIDRVNRNFLWGSTESTKKMHWVNWHKVTKPKEVGGLGLQSAKGRNTVLLAKLNWRFHTESDSQWARVLRLKYYTRLRVDSRNGSRLPCSITWRSMKKGEDVFNNGVKWIPGYDSSLNFWSDRWLNHGPIRHLIHGPLPRDTAYLKVKDVAAPYGWDWSVIPFKLSNDIKAEIQAVSMPILSRGTDKIAWSPSPKGTFELKSAYFLAVDPFKTESFPGKWIWKLNTLPRIQAFVWKCMHGSIRVKECLVGRGINQDPTCPLCHLELESVSHALRDCMCIKPIWTQLCCQALNSSFFFSIN